MIRCANGLLLYYLTLLRPKPIDEKASTAVTLRTLGTERWAPGGGGAFRKGVASN